MKAFGETSDAALFLCDFALAAHSAGLQEVARAQAKDALDSARAVGFPLGRGRAALVAAFLEGPGPDGDALLSEALDITEKWDLGALWIRRERAFGGRLLGRALARGVGRADLVEGLLSSGGGAAIAGALAETADAPEARARLAELAAEARDVDIGVIDGLLRDPVPAVRDAARSSWRQLKTRSRTAVSLLSLGELRILRDGVPVPPAAFDRQKARALLAALLAAWGPVHRDTLCERLWPELAPDRAAAALRTTLHHLRRAIEPEVSVGEPSSLVVADGEMIRLRLAEHDSWDAVQLMTLARPPAGGETPQQEIERLTAADELYGGPFLMEWPFEDWATDRRAELQDVHADVLSRLADALLKAGRSQEAIVRYRRLVRLDPNREGWHHALMRAYAAAGERAMALRQYHACRSRLRRDQGVEPGPEIHGLYLNLLREEDDEVTRTPS